MAALSEVGQLRVGATPRPNGESTVGYVRAGSISETGTVTGLTLGAEPTRGRDARLAAGDVVVRARGTPAAAVVERVAEGAYPTNDVLLFRADQSKVEPTYLAALLNLPASQDVLSSGSHGAALSRLSVQTLGEFEVPLPSLEVQRKIAAVAHCMRAEQDILEKLQGLRRRLHQQVLRQLISAAVGGMHSKGQI